jgi:hypothetical protein
VIPEPATVTTLDRDHIVGWWRDVHFIFWYGETRMPAVHALREDLQRMVESRPGGIAAFVLVAEHVALPAGSARTQLARLLREHAPSIRASCVAVEGSGFRAATVRSVLAGMSFIVRPGYPHRVTDSLIASADWLAATCGNTLERSFSVAEIRHALMQVRNVGAAAA